MPGKKTKRLSRRQKSAARQQKSLSPFDAWRQSLCAADAVLVEELFANVRRHTALSAKENAALIGDFEQALLYYHQTGLPLMEALSRLDPESLGGFYARPPVLWFPLDDAAKIYPLSIKHGQMALFRLAVNLQQPVVPALLQMALNVTVGRFPSFATTVKKGVFWHYLDTAKRRYVVEPETGMPCQPLSISGSGAPSFRVLYFDRRISVEFFHALTDGTGGMVFLKTLTAQYLRLLGAPVRFERGVLNPADPPDAQESANEFLRVGREGNASGFSESPAVQLSGRIAFARPCRVLHFRLDAAKLQAVAKARNTTVTVYLLSRLFAAQRYATDEMQGDMSIQVPVNMRKFVPSATLRNFSQYCCIRLNASCSPDPDALLDEIGSQLRQKASEDSMTAMLRATDRLVRALRLLPLFIKSPAARILYGFLGENAFTNTLSNLGVVDLPGELGVFVDSMDFVLGPSPINRASCAMVTFGNKATLSITKSTSDPTFEEALYRLLCADGLTPTVEGTADCDVQSAKHTRRPAKAKKEQP